MRNVLSKLFIFLGKALSEDNNVPSSARIFNFYAVTILIPCVAFTLIYVTLCYKELIGATLDAVLLFVAGIFGLKVLQKGKEGTSNVKGEMSNVKNEAEAEK